MMKKILVGLCLLISGIAYSDSNVYLTNKTKQPIGISVLQAGSKTPLYKKVTTSVAANKRQQVVRINRNVGVKNGQTYYFIIQLDGPSVPNKNTNKAIWLVQKVVGKAVGSTAWFGITNKNLDDVMNHLAKVKWIPQGTGSANLGVKVGNVALNVTGKWKYEVGDIYEDIEYSITPAGTVTPKNELNLWQHNIQQRPIAEGLKYEATFGVSHSERSRLSTIVLPDAIRKFDPNIDVITVNEAFTGRLRPELRDNMEKNGFVYSTSVLNKNDPRPWSGGVMVFSKYPITKTKEYTYKLFLGLDTLAAKGVLYVQIDKMGKLYNIFATHTNASYDFKGKTRLPMTDKGRIARSEQLKEMKKFIDAQRIPSNQPVIMVGDMNVDMISEKGQKGDEYSYLLKTLNAIHPPVSGHKYTLDRNTNEWVDPDDGPPQYLDYALYSKAHQRPTSASNKPICLKSNGKSICSKKPKGARDLSDHYPIRAKFVFPK